MEDLPLNLPDDNEDSNPNERFGLQDRFERAVRGLSKPKGQQARRELKSITNNVKRERLFLVNQLVKLGMAIEQIADFLPTWGLPLSRTTLYEYLGLMKLPRYYCTSEGQQSHHDYYTFRFFIRIAEDAALSGYRTSRLAKGTAPAEGARFRPDFKFEIGPYRFFIEMQLSDLTETLWTVKFRNYLKLRKILGKPFRALFIIDQKGDLTYARRFVRKLVEQRPPQERDLFLFVNLDDLKGAKNVATDPLWLTPWGKRVRLLEYLSPPGQKPVAQLPTT